MATTLINGNVGTNIAALFSNPLGTLTNAQTSQLPVNLTLPFSLSPGTGGALKCNQVLSLQGTIATTAHTDIDLYANGAATDALGNAVTMAVVKFLFIQNLGNSAGGSVEADALKIGSISATTQWTSFFVTNADGIILPGPLAASSTTSFLMVCCNGSSAYAVGASTTNHLLRLTSTGSNTIGYNVIAFGSTS